jgi:hypothetical protein
MTPWPIRADSRCVFSPADLGVKMGSSCVKVPHDVARVFRSLGVEEAGTMVCALREWSSVFFPLGLDKAATLAVADTLEIRFSQKGIASCPLG